MTPEPHDGFDVPGPNGPGGAWNFDAWSDGASDEQLALQADLSCLVDGELDEAAAARAMVALEESEGCRAFFDDLQRFARMHRDMSDPEQLEARLVMLGAGEVARVADDVDLAHRLATIFYQLGKAYTLAGIDAPGFAERVFEAAVPVEEQRRHGRGFVDGVVASGRADGATPGRGVDWTNARHMLNGRLERIQSPLEKGRRLLEQAIEIDPSHEEARIYIAFLFAQEGRHMRAAELFRDVFETGIDLANRGHAAMQLGRLHHREGDLRGALRHWRWMSMSGLVGLDARFALVHFNIGIAHLERGAEDRALDAFRDLLDAHLERAPQVGAPDAGSASTNGPVDGPEHGVDDVARLFHENVDAREIIDRTPGFLPRLAARLPELFDAPAAGH